MKPDQPPVPSITDLSEGSDRILGERLRQLRKRRKMTLAQLAEGCGLSIGYLSQIERNLAEPSINALFSIAHHLGVTVQWFFSGEEEAVPVEEHGYVIRRANRLRVNYEQGIVDELLTPRMSMTLEMIQSHMPPGSEVAQAYSHEGDEVGLVISGQMELWVGERHFMLQAGDSFSHSSREPHRYRNPGPGDTVVVWAISPPSY
ncbi:helix-turn-helix domain-containing protein [Gemmobacter serpentinus]|uniref:helix-turn-helix domain-containing protein n=1 Tax=Gemmobacter serpentinus TaxID=2652247 RepID=UPI00124C4693|nr:XRE family transcriptional regulator [Gemmobacter serpentinus]